jgi:cobalt-zinc-cadmium efflux system protein
MSGHGHGHGHGHAPADGGPVDRRFLIGALSLILAFMAAEVVIGLLASSLALLSDAGHMLTDAAAIALAVIASRLAERPARGNFTFGWKRVEILAAQANGVTLLVLVVVFAVEAVRRLLDPPHVHGGYVLGTALVGVVVNIAATWLVARAGRGSLNVEGAFQHILTDLYAFIATAVAGLVIVVGGWQRADAVAAAIVALLMLVGGWRLIRDSWLIFLEAAPKGIRVSAIDRMLHATDGVVEVHDLHVWEVTSGFPALSAHVLIDGSYDCHERRRHLAEVLAHDFGIEHSTLQLDHPEPPQLIAPEDLLGEPADRPT